MDMTPVEARPRMASPRSMGSIFTTSAPQSDRRADAAGTKVCSATSRMRTPSITAVTTLEALPPCRWPATAPGNLTLTSTSIVDRRSRPPSRPGGRPLASLGCRSGFAAFAHHDDHLADGMALGDVAQGGGRVRETERAADQRRGAAVFEETEELALVACHLVGLVGAEAPHLEPEDRDALE